MSARYRTARDYLASLAPSGYWPLGEAVGDALDASGNGNHGTVTYAEGQRGQPPLDDRGDGGLRFEEGTTNLWRNPIAGAGATTHVVTTGTNVVAAVTFADEGIPNPVIDGVEITTGFKITLGDTPGNLIAEAGFAAAAGAAAFSAAVWVGADYNGANVRALGTAGFVGATSTDTTEWQTSLQQEWVQLAHLLSIDAGDTFGNPRLQDPAGAATAGTIYCTAFQFEQKSRRTSLAVGSFGTGYSWAGTAHASASTRVATSVDYGDQAAHQDIWDGGGALALLANITDDGDGDAGTLASKGWSLKTTDDDGADCRLQLTVPFSTTNGVWRTDRAVPLGTDIEIEVLYDAGAVGNDPAIRTTDLSTGARTTHTITETQTPVGTRTTDAGTDFIVGNVPAGNETAHATIDEPAVWQGTQPTLAQFTRWVSLVLEAERIALEAARVYLHDGSFRRIGQLTTAASINRSYRVDNTAGQASVEVAVDDPLIAETGDQGNVLVVESAAYPDPWVGKVVRRRGNIADGTVMLEARSFDSILDERILPTGYRTSGSAGMELARVISTVNGRNPTGISVGDIQNHIVLVSGLQFPEWTARRALDALADQSGLEWWLEYEVTPTNIEIRFRVARSRGFDRYRQASLVDGGNVTVEDWTDEFEASAFALTVVAGQTTVTESFTERVRSTQIVETGGGFITSYETVPASQGGSGGTVDAGGTSGSQSIVQGAHGYVTIATSVRAPTTRREVAIVREEIKTRDVVAQAAQALLRQRRLAEKVVSVTHLDWTQWDALEIGSVVRFVSHAAFVEGFDGPARILGAQPMEELGSCDLVLELLEDPEAA